MTEANSSATCVCVRLRPPNSRESGVRCLQAECGGGGGDGGQVAFVDGSAGAGATSNSFRFDKVYGEGASQRDVFEDCRRVVDGVLEGINGTIMAYGQTGSGKTHTLIGEVTHPELRGVVPRSVEALGEGIATDTSGAEYEVRLTVVEIYCERVRDLLDPLGRDNLAIKQGRDGGIYVEGATEVCVTSEEQLVGVMEAGLAQRAVTATHMNAASSRSHCIVTVAVEKACPDGTTVSGKLRMVDLAGSERQDKTGAAGQTLVEGSLINRSLSALANVVAALTDGGGAGTGGKDGAGGSRGNAHVPYRDSKLTRMLQDSLGGSARTLLIINCSPCADNAAETLSSLRFGSRALGIKNRVAPNRRLSPEALQRQLAEARAQVEALQKELAALRASPGAGGAAGPACGSGSGSLVGGNTGLEGGAVANASAAEAPGSSAAGDKAPAPAAARGWAGLADPSWACGAVVAAGMLLCMGLEDVLLRGRALAWP